MDKNTIITLIVALVVLIAGGTYLFISYKKKNKSESKPSNINVVTLLEALGGSNNILNTSLENKRLKILLENPKLVSQTLLKSMDISGFLTGKELKLLIKENPVEVKNNLDKIRNEVTK
ncbi:hypothetical protein [Acholeplasma hippikon]|uniref:hypothetical protein n=1 Tax=Acholeplasma hippikon TaxID=264636 RepID=UPI00138E39BF|nr:hypothetical protein [Acholeplasma hippikon]